MVRLDENIGLAILHNSLKWMHTAHFYGEENPKMSAASVLVVPAIGVVAWVIGGWMITDSMNNKSKGKVLSRTAGIAGGFVIGFIAFVISMIVIGANDESGTIATTQEVSTNVSENSVDADAKDAKTFDITSETYVKRINKVLSRMEKPIKIDVQMKELEFSSFGEYLFDKNIKLSVMANNGDHKLRGAIITSINDGTTETSLKTVYLLLPAFMSVMDEKKAKGIPFVEVITNLMTGKYPDDTYEINGVHYSLVHKDGGDFFFIRPI